MLNRGIGRVLGVLDRGANRALETRYRGNSADKAFRLYRSLAKIFINI